MKETPGSFLNLIILKFNLKADSLYDKRMLITPFEPGF